MEAQKYALLMIFVYTLREIRIRVRGRFHPLVNGDGDAIYTNVYAAVFFGGSRPPRADKDSKKLERGGYCFERFFPIFADDFRR
jgi:hypothetical protein